MVSVLPVIFLLFVRLACKSHLHVGGDERNHKKTAILSCHEANRMLLLLCKSNVDEKHALKQNAPPAISVGHHLMMAVYNTS